MLRRTLARTSRTTGTLDEELEYLKAYLAVEQQRYGDRLQVSWDIADETRRMSLPPLLLQPLVENALKHGLGARLEGGHLAIVAAREGDSLRLSVTDDGAGLPVAAAGRHRHRQPAPPALHPLRRPAPLQPWSRATATTVAHARPAGGRLTMRVLIVDDEPAARARLHTMLEELDVEVTGEAANGLEALDRVSAQRPDVLLLDIAMPEVDGFDVVAASPRARGRW